MDRECLVGILRGKGIGVTEPRIVILDYLMSHMTHPTVDIIFNDLRASCPNLSRTTVYNTVQILSQNGLAQMISIDDEHVNIDGDVSPHAHLLCRRCGRIIDMPLKGVTEEISGKSFEMDGNIVEEVHQYYRGICADCRKMQESEVSEYSENNFV